MKVIGLTGGIASGKSTVSSLFKELGAPVIDADELARDVVAPGTPGLAEVAKRFPEVVVNGVLDRAALGVRVFANPDERNVLNGLLHPRIQERYREKVQALEAQGRPVVIYDAALLFENQLEERLDGVILVSVPRPVQRERLRARSGLDEAQADARISAQMPIEEKAKRATWVIDNSRDLVFTREQVERLWKLL
ncbi:MAG: dephospho-CoA kinase [Myxococcaceae bacterium]